MDLFTPGHALGGDHLIAHLNAHQNNPYIQTWQARAADGQEVVLKICHNPGYTFDSRNQVESSLDIPSMPGIAPFLGYHEIEWQGKKFVAIRRRYYPTRLIDLFPADVAHPPSRSLLDNFALLAGYLDTLEKEAPRLDFSLSPGDLLMDGDKLIITDFGMSTLILNLEPDYRQTPTGMMARTEPERGVPLMASYPSLEGRWRGTRTDAQYAVAALYIYVRSHFQIFEDRTNPFPKEAKGILLLTWLGHVFEATKRYQEIGQIALPMLPDEREQKLVSRALARDPAERYASGTAFVGALHDLLP